MNKYPAIGGYFALELCKNSYPHKNALHLNLARSAIKLIIKTHNIKEIFIPYFTCKSVLDSIKEQNCNIRFYHINEDLSPRLDCKKHCWIIYNDYFGINKNNVKLLNKKYKNLIIDNAQSFFAKKSKICFYSPRKFLGVSDGGILYDNKSKIDNIKQDSSLYRAKYLFTRIENGAEAGYSDFLKAEKSHTKHIKTMSNLTYTLLQSIDYKQIKQKRIKNYNYLNNALKNSIKPNLESDEIPMIYPYFGDKSLREKLIKNKIFVATYWNDMEMWCEKKSFELHLRDHLLPLPIDQRYGEFEMNRIIKITKWGGVLDDRYNSPSHITKYEVHCA
ncbi:hypothetical protein [Helicobacter sp. MIT 99-5507]|uniref:hypothetical protein n=1 Tax=Helicobacter sp. MIT 99-5507 TaxID=152489 RepID=UPI000E1EEE3E|nr:hypothetical protein [Helicobacter sp. MIT 99-5507]RDU58612.1 hypothetical protein CQA42_02180 [Helicobacter sp. MIT 99-5507]